MKIATCIVAFIAFGYFETAMADPHNHLSQTEISDKQSKAQVVNAIVKDREGDGDVAEKPERRCAFSGRCGSFTILGPLGTAAYKIGGKGYIADLVVSDPDPNWWLYKPVSNGDPSTKMWAFARKPRCGKYSVLRFSNGAWRVYERTEAWGQGLGEDGTFAAEPTYGAPGASIDEVLDKLRDIEGKLKAIQPGPSPSLLDLERKIEAAR
ncbi:hypothetical protein [Bremerella cremea]|uniref:hypothetical protein n=1 Tax=Bremerella cremea TaxID=1031537 RepID=UPI0031E5DD59